MSIRGTYLGGECDSDIGACWIDKAGFANRGVEHEWWLLCNRLVLHKKQRRADIFVVGARDSNVLDNAGIRAGKSVLNCDSPILILLDPATKPRGNYSIK